MESAAITKRRWKSWKPWAVAGAGVAVAGIGGLLQLKAQSDFDAYGKEIARSCGDKGCYPDEILDSTKNLESSAKMENYAAITSFAIGGALVVTGVVMLIMNSPKTYMPEDVNAGAREEKTVLVPSVSPNGDASLTLLTRF